ncbi:hypothetical protein POVCU1_072190, partial [Plasmodium ovale curtisi]
YNAATLNDRYREKLNSLKNDRKTQNINVYSIWSMDTSTNMQNRNVLDNINEDINDSLQIYERENDYSKPRGYNIAYSS